MLLMTSNRSALRMIPSSVSQYSVLPFPIIKTTVLVSRVCKFHILRQERFVRRRAITSGCPALRTCICSIQLKERSQITALTCQIKARKQRGRVHYPCSHDTSSSISAFEYIVEEHTCRTVGNKSYRTMNKNSPSVD